MKQPQILTRTQLAAGRHLSLHTVEFMDDRGRIRKWEAAGRVGGLGAVMIIAVLQPDDRIVLIRQFRPPAGKYLIEFPAGLIDPGETPEKTAVRELFEETGYRGDIIRVLPPTYNSPGMSGETITPVVMHIQAELYRENPPTPHPVDSESIECFTVPRTALISFLKEAQNRGDGLDAKVVAYAIAHVL